MIIGLNKIQQQTGLIFSYSSSIINNLAPVSVNIIQKTVREALALLLPNNITVRSKNNYIILKERVIEKNPKKTELSGYVYDKTTDKKLANVTIYDKTSLQSVTTDEYGFYSISIPTKNQSIIVNKVNYEDTVLKISDLKNNLITFINLNPIADSIKNKDSVLWKAKLKDFSHYTNNMFRKFKGYVNTLNIKDTMARNFQVSLIPFVGTNGLLSGNIYNKYSLNVFGGYSRGTNLLELGGFFNIDRENSKGAQLAGFFNIVGDSVKGAQLAGFFNITGKNMWGAQAAGFWNLNIGNSNGVNAAGFVNTNMGKTKGAQLAGFVNIAADSMKGAQLAGYFNHAKSLDGIQVSGFANNTAGNMDGIQVSGFFNHAKKVNGLQVGFFNFSDTCAGAAIGIFSFVKKGLHQIEFSSDEVQYANLSFRTGVHKFYNIFSVGITPSANEPLWSFGYGLGTSFKIKNKLRSDVTLSAHHISIGGFNANENELYKLYWGLEYKFKKRFSIAAGPVFNLYLANTYAPGYNLRYDNVAPYLLFTSNISAADGYNLKGWVGGKIAIRFL
ncbi:MAG: carboxypeptidase-like regulatory domain-containing protein [Bacteroidetes bacterium]|nr:carboxypeptidase-like regulatory domain-containing protein [Bacteroidota bacterium]